VLGWRGAKGFPHKKNALGWNTVKPHHSNYAGVPTLSDSERKRERRSKNGWWEVAMLRGGAIRRGDGQCQLKEGKRTGQWKKKPIAERHSGEVEKS